MMRAGGFAGPKSSDKDEVDDIYKSEDPIEVTIKKRVKEGTKTSTVKEETKQGKFFFTLKLKGAQPVLKGPPKTASMMAV